jgi:hypothetical protein
MARTNLHAHVNFVESDAARGGTSRSSRILAVLVHHAAQWSNGQAI